MVVPKDKDNIVDEETRRTMDAVQKSMSGLAPVYDRIQATLNRLDEELAPMLERLPGTTRSSVQLLAESGWFVDFSMTPREVAAFASQSKKSPDGADEALSEYFDDASARIEQEASSAFPKRAAILQEAFAAHRFGQYVLSIPVMLAQADGFWWDRTGHSLYNTRNGVPRLGSTLVAGEPGSLRDALLSPFELRLPLSLPVRFRPYSFHELNRHQVLHGESVVYGTRTFGCKTISLVSFLVGLLGEKP